MKQLDPIEKVIGENKFYIRPFPAFVAANISGELWSVLTPILGGLAPVLMHEGDVSNMDMESVLPLLSSALTSLSGDKFESIIRKLLTNHKNIAVENEDTEGKAVMLTYDLANEVFCGEVQDMYVLCFEVIKLNYSGFFKKIGDRFGNLSQLSKTLMGNKTDSDSSTPDSSATSN